MMKKTLCALALAAISLSAQAGIRLVENFETPTFGPFTGNLQGDLASRGYTLRNDSVLPGSNGFFAGDATNALFVPGVGGTGGYLAANYNGASAGGTLDEIFITPTFSRSSGGYVQFYLRGGDGAPDYTDYVQFGFSSGTSLATSAFSFVNPFIVPTNDWTLFTVSIPNAPDGTSGRFAIRYVGQADTANVIGIDRLVIQVPEPASVMLFGLGFAGLVAARRRAAK